MATKVDNDPFSNSEYYSEKEPHSQDDPQEITEQNLSIEEISKILQEKGVIRNTFNKYEVITELSKVGRKWCYDSYVTVNGKKIDELILPSEHGSSRAIEKEETPPTSFVKRASQKHLDQCHNVQELIEEENRERRARRRRTIIQFLVLLLLIALIAGGGYYLYPLLIELKEKRHVDTTVGQPVGSSSDTSQLILEYATIRGKVEPDQNGIPTITLKKTDVVTINVIDQNTGKTVAQGIINIQLVDETQLKIED